MVVITCGELLIDFVSTGAGVSLAQAPAFKKSPGGALANVAVGVARFGYRAGFIGQVGDDEFGHFLADPLHSHGVDITGLRLTSGKGRPTTLARAKGEEYANTTWH
jgi:fructokinase